MGNLVVATGILVMMHVPSAVVVVLYKAGDTDDDRQGIVLYVP